MDEALAARADVRLLFDADGKLLPVQHWPDEIAYAVETFELKRDGCVKVKFASKLKALRVILEVAGILNGPRERGIDPLALLAKRY